MSKVTQCQAIAHDIPAIVEEYTNATIPTDITDDEIDKWLAIIPDLMSFWEGEVAEKKKELDVAQYDHTVAYAVAFTEAPDSYAIKMKETHASLNAQVHSLATKIITIKYELKLLETLFGKAEHKSKSIHKIASLRARRLEVGVVVPTIRGDNSCRKNPQTVPAKDYIRNEFRQESRKELNDEF